MLSHVTTVVVRLDELPASRAAALAGALRAQGFAVRRERRRLVAESARVEAADAREALLALGFDAREFELRLEYARSWGYL